MGSLLQGSIAEDGGNAEKVDSGVVCSHEHGKGIL
jgi:hypothetical protein